MNERDELIAILHREATADRVKNSPLRDVPVVAAKVEAAADAILAAGYRRPRVVTTVAELDALPNGTILLAGDRYPRYKWTVWRVKQGGVGAMIEQVGKELAGVTPSRYFKDPLPATVLHEPEADQ